MGTTDTTHDNVAHDPRTSGGPVPAPSGAGAPAGAPPASGQGNGSPSAPAPPATPAERIAQLEAQLTDAKHEAAANWDKFLRERAEMENFKRRIERTSADQARRERKELLLKFLNVLDNLERALSYGSTTGQETDVSGLLTGLRLTESQFRDLLASAGASEVAAVGQPFDPAKHEAVATAVSEDVPEGHVLQELQKGYLYGDELLRPARVRVATRA